MKRRGSEPPPVKKTKLRTHFGQVNLQNPQVQIPQPLLPPPPRVEPYLEHEYDGWDDYYAYASKILPISQNLVEIKFECVSSFWFAVSTVLHQPESYYKAYKVVPTSIVIAQATLVQAQAAPPEGPLNLPGEPLIGGVGLTLQVTAQPIQEGQWYRLRLGGRINNVPIRPGPPPQNGRDPQLVILTPKGFQYGTTRVRDLRAVADVSVQDRQSLENYFSISHMIVEQEAAYDNPALAFVGMLNVGQGSCCALYDHTGRPFLYHDFGRALSSHERPRPTPLSACLSGSPTILLSHLDGDHYTMVDDVQGAYGVPWIIPEPPGGITGPDIWGFVNRVAHKRIWPHINKAFEEYDWGFILKGTSEQPGSHGKNNAGLVALVRVKNDTNAPPVGQRKALDTEGRRPQIFPDERYVLLTADVPCGYIESLVYHDLDGKLVAMTAPHHGAETDLNWDYLPVPAAPIDGVTPVIGYSYGIRTDNGANSFGHPRGEALTQFATRGFHHRVNTMTQKNPAVPLDAHPHAHQASCVLFARLQGAHPGALSVAGQAATAAMNTYTLQRATALQSLHNSAAAYAAFMAAKTTAANGASTIPNVNAAALAAFNQAHGINGTTNQAAFNLVHGTVAATKPLTVTKYQNFWSPLWQTAVNDATQAQADALTVSQRSVQTPRPQRTRCDGAGSLALPDPGGGVLNVEQTPYNTPVVGLIPFNEAVNIAGAAPASTVTHNNHRLRTGDTITIANNAVNAGYRGQTVQVTVATANTYTIPIGANGQDENGIQASGYRVAREGKFVETVNIAGGNPNSTITHNNHGLKTGDVITVVQAVNVAFQNQTHPITYVDANSYTVPINAAGQNENGVQITGFRLAGSFAETVTIAGGNPNSTITHNNHRLQNGNNVTFPNIPAVPAQFRGRTIAIAVVNGNSYTVAVNAAGVNANNVPVTGVRSGRGQMITPTRWNFDRTISLVGGNNTATVTCNNHNLRTGDTITIDPGSVAVNAVYQNQAVVITRTGDNTFTIPIGNNGQNENNIPARGVIPTRWYFNATVNITGGVGTATVTRRDHNLRTGETITIDPASACAHAVYRNQTVAVTRVNDDTFTIPIGVNGQNANNVRAVGVNPVQTRHGITRPSIPQLQATLDGDYVPFVTATQLGNCDAGHTTFQSLVRHN